MVPPRPPEDHRPKLIAPAGGRYLITRGGEEIGTETFTITSTGGVWRATGRLDLVWPVERTEGYVLEIDQATREPLAVAAWIELLGEKQSVRGRRDAAGEYFNFEMQTIAGPHRRQIPYAPGTVLDFSSPIFNTLVLAMLGPSMQIKKPLRIRTITLTVPQLEPAVMIQTYELFAIEGDTKKIAVSSVAGQKPNAFWVRPDGLPIKVRTWVDGGPPFVIELETPAN